VIPEGSAYSIKYEQMELDRPRGSGPRDPVILDASVILDGAREKKLTQQKISYLIL